MADPQQGVPKSFIPDERGASTAAPKSFQADEPKRSTGADIAIGAGKSVARNLLDMGVAASRFDPVSNAFLGPLRLIGADKALGFDKYLPGYVPQGTREVLAPENDVQRNAGILTDVASSLVGPGVASRAASLVRRGARGIERSAVPMSDQAADFVLKNWAGRPTQANAAALEAAAKAIPAGARVTPKPHVPAVQEAASAMRKAADAPSDPYWKELALVGGGSLFSPKLAATMGVLKMLNRPGVKATVAQGTYGASPVLGAMGAGATIPVVRQVLDWLGVK